MLLLSIDDIKDLIRFAKAEKVKKMQIGNINFELSDYALIDELYTGSEPENTPQKEETFSSKNMVDTNVSEQNQEDDSLLFWSSNS